ncbi:hypothetical protein E5AUHO_41450 [Citrobacter freundii]|nr:hypothetical protein E5AUHO_41450 [Citrobacter freundii]
MAVGVRFHDRNQFAGWSQFTQTLQVVSQSAAVNDYSCRLHLYSLIKEFPKSFVLQDKNALAFLNSACAGPEGARTQSESRDKPENPRELSKLSDWGERA